MSACLDIKALSSNEDVSEQFPYSKQLLARSVHTPRCYVLADSAPFMQHPLGIMDAIVKINSTGLLRDQPVQFRIQAGRQPTSRELGYVTFGSVIISMATTVIFHFLIYSNVRNLAMK